MSAGPSAAPAIAPLPLGLTLPDSSTQEKGPTAGSSSYSPNLAAQSPSQSQLQAQPQTANRFLSPDEWARVAHSLGAVKGGSEDHGVVHPSSWYFPPKGLPKGLYRDVVCERAKFRFMYHFLNGLHCTLMVLQIVLGAILTALGSADLRYGTPITVLAASQTVVAGLLALMHNSGLPERYRFLRYEFAAVEDRLSELLDTGIVPDGRSVDDIIAGCWADFQAAKGAIQANIPANFISSHTLPPRPRKMAADGAKPKGKSGNGDGTLAPN